MKQIIYVLALLLVLAGCAPYVPTTNTTNDTNTTSDLTLSNETILVPVVEKNESKTETQEQSDMPKKQVKEGDLVQFKEDIAFDPDGDKLTYTFSAPLDKEGVWQTKLGDAGDYIITITVSDGKLESTQKVKLVVESVNQLPKISGLSDVAVKEGEKIELNPKVTDADGDNVTVSYSGFMKSAEYTTTFSDAGKYEVTVTANDGKQTSSKTIDVVVENVNRAPVVDLSKAKDITVKAGEKVSVEVSAQDADGDKLTIEYGKPLDKNGNWQTNASDAGTYEIDVKVSDGEKTVTKTITVVVEALNEVPSLKVPQTIEVDEGETITIDPVVSDADGDALKIKYSGFMTSSTYKTTYSDAGTYKTTVSVSDGKETVTKEVSIVINNVNRAPEFVGDDLFE